MFDPTTPGVKMPVPGSVTSAALAAVVLCAGCVQQVVELPRQATPSWSCTPVAGGTPYPCYEKQYQEAAAQNQLYEEAEAVYRKYQQEYERIYRAGGVSEPTPRLLETATGEVLDSAMENFRGLLSDRTRLVSGRFLVAWIKPLPDLVEHGSLAAIEVCGDVSEAVLQDKGGKPYKVGQDTDERYYLLEVDGQLKLSVVEHKWVNAC